MKWHPASMMLAVWLSCFALFFALPFELIGRELTTYGLVMLALSILAFCVGGWFRSTAIPQMRSPITVKPDFSRADRMLTIAAAIGMLALFIDWRNNGAALSGAWDIRSDRTTALLNGEDSGSSLTFQLGFLFAPVGYVIIVREILFGGRSWLLRLGVFGFGPLLLSALALGGRGPLLWGFTIAALARLTKRWTIDPPKLVKRREYSARAMLIGLLAVIAGLAALNYFVQVFIIRADAAGGVDSMFDTVAQTWGVTFSGPRADLMKRVLGIGNTYLIFAFAWYIVQGIVISNTLFTDYIGPPQLGVYGIELMGALVRRLDGAYVGASNLYLNDLNVFGFLPSAFGTLYVDYWYFGVLVAAIWGYLATLVYERVRRSPDLRWALAAPFVMQGILTSVINTPLGATNGLVTLLWMIAAFLAARPGKQIPVLAGRSGQ